MNSHVSNKHLVLKVLLSLIPTLILYINYAWITTNHYLLFGFIVFWILTIVSVFSFNEKNNIFERLFRLTEIAFFLLPLSAIIFSFSFGAKAIKETTNQFSQAGAAIGSAIGGTMVIIIAFIIGLIGGVIFHIISNKYEKKLTDKENTDKESNVFGKHGLIITLGITILIFLVSALIPKNSLNNITTNNTTNQGNKNIVVNEEEKKKEEEKKFKLAENIKKLEQIEIVSSKIEPDDYGFSDYLNIKLKNNTSRDIDAITVSSFFVDNYGEPVGQFTKNREPFFGQSQDVFKNGATQNLSFSLMSYSGAKKAIEVKVVKVHFVDGETIDIEDSIK